MNRLTRFAWLLMAMGAAHAATTLTRTTSYQYDSDGYLIQETSEPNNSALRVDSAYGLDDFGNRSQVTASSTASGAAAVASRVTTATYGGNGRFVTRSTNALDHQETRSYDSRFGAVTSLTGPNGLTTNWQYDGFGRKVKEIRADGTQTTWSYTLCNGGCPGNGVLTSAFYYITETPLDVNGAQNGPVSKVYNDPLDREIRREVQGFDGSTIITLTQYDNLGRVVAVSRPYYSGSTVYWTQAQFDQLDRKTSETAPDNSVTSYAYNGLTVSATNASSQTTAKTHNSRGETVKITDANGKILQLAYDPFGNLLQTTDPVGNHITNTFDLLGRKLTTSDPDMGSWSYQYDGFGQLIQQTDAKGQITSYQYDKLGRLTQRGEPGLTSTWTFDSCSMGVGKLCASSSDNLYSQTLSYDSLGRASGSTTQLDTGYSFSNQYDINGRLSGQSYPFGKAVKYVYTSLGYLSEVRDAATDQLYWKANTYDAEGNLLLQTLGNGLPVQQVYDPKTGRQTAIYAGAGNSVLNLTYQYDSIGNLMNRTDANLNVNETFLYDKLNRLTASQGAGLPTIGYSYDDLGNITSRSDVGTYSYNATKPHAVASIAGTVNTSFSYDANGNQTAGNGRTISYNSFNLPESVNKGSQTDQFLYGPDHQRIKQTSTATGTTWYLNPDNAGGLMFEKEQKTDGTVENHYYLNAAGKTFALLTTKNDGSSNIRYWHKDELGSLTAVTDEQGNVVERLSYEAFGKRRNTNGTTDPNNTITGQTTERGYTGHEHLDDVGLIHMNGRVYDPLIGRFMEADPTVPNADWLQDYNRYSYLQNNPFAGTDPTGFIYNKPQDTSTNSDSTLSDALNKVGDLGSNWGGSRGTNGGDRWAGSGIKVANSTAVAGNCTCTNPFGGPSLADLAIKEWNELLERWGIRRNTDFDVFKNERPISPSLVKPSDRPGRPESSRLEGNEPSRLDGKPADQQQSPKDLTVNQEAKTKDPKPGASGKEAAKDVPSWAKGQRPRVGENGKQFADRLMGEKYPDGYPKGPGTEYNKIQKWGDRGFVDPKN